ncbi:MAG: hypothetical protein R6V31_09690, partial [Halohasta sp.]
MTTPSDVDESATTEADTDTEVPGNSEDPNADRQYHLEVVGDDIADSVLLPGNPERIGTITDLWDDATTVASHREYRTATVVASSQRSVIVPMRSGLPGSSTLSAMSSP